MYVIRYKAFPFSEIAFRKDSLSKLPQEVRVFLEKTDMDVSNNLEYSLLQNF